MYSILLEQICHPFLICIVSVKVFAHFFWELSINGLQSRGHNVTDIILGFFHSVNRHLVAIVSILQYTNILFILNANKVKFYNFRFFQIGNEW